MFWWTAMGLIEIREDILAKRKWPKQYHRCICSPCIKLWCSNLWNLSMKSSNHWNVRAIILRCRWTRSNWENDVISGKAGHGKATLEMFSHFEICTMLFSRRAIQNCMSLNNLKSPLCKTVVLCHLGCVWPLRIKTICLNTHHPPPH